MAQLDWLNENANRSYPFIQNNDATLNNSEILDCGFYIYNDKEKTVWLKSKELSNNTVSYTFTYDDCPADLTFTASLTGSEWQTCWSSNNYWQGFCIIGITDQI